MKSNEIFPAQEIQEAVDYLKSQLGEQLVGLERVSRERLIGLYYGLLTSKRFFEEASDEADFTLTMEAMIAAISDMMINRGVDRESLSKRNQ